MHVTTNVYNSILKKPYDTETKLDIYTADGKTLVGSYGEDVLVSVQITGKLFSSPNVGAAVGREIDVKMLMPTETLPRMAMLKPFVRIKYGTDVSEWIQKGVYFIDTRSTDKLTDVLTIHGYDAMLKTEQLYCGSGDVGEWPRQMRTVAYDICSKIGVILESLTAISDTYKCQLDTTFSMRDYLSHIAAAHAGVFMMTDTGVMRLVPLKHDGTAVADLGQNVDLLEQSPALAAYDRVVINVSQESVYAYPVEETTGRTLELECRWGSEAMAQDIHGLVNGFVYQPYETGNALIHPAIEIGDAITIDGKLCGIYQMNITCGAMLNVKIAAPADDEVDHEYHYTSPIEKVKKQLATATAELRVLDDSIEAEVKARENADTELESKITQTAEEITAKVEKQTEKIDGLDEAIADQSDKIDGLEKTVTDNYSEFKQTADGFTATVEEQTERIDGLNTTVERNYSEFKQTAGGFEQRITDAEGNITAITSSIGGISQSVSNAEGMASEALQTADGFSQRITDAEGKATEAQQTADGFSQRISDAEGNISSIEHTLDGVVYSNANGTTVIDGGHIDTENMRVGNANITSLDVGKLRVNGAAITASNPWDTTYHSVVHLITPADGYVVLDAYGVNSVYGSNPAGSVSWNKIIEVIQNGGSDSSTAVFG